MNRRPDLKQAALSVTADLTDDDVLRLCSKIIILVSAPRSGSTLLFQALSAQPDIWTIGGESHGVFQAFPHLKAENKALDSMALDDSHADPHTCNLFRRCFLTLLLRNDRMPFMRLRKADRPEIPVILEKTPRNALNFRFLQKVFPNARFIYLYRDPRQAVSSLIEAWETGLRSGRFVTFTDLPNWHLPAWCFVLPKGWQHMRGKTLPEIAAFQWAACQKAIIDGLRDQDPGSYYALSYGDFVAQPVKQVLDLGNHFDLHIDKSLISNGAMPLSRTTISPPDPEKWRRHEDEIMSIWPSIEKTIIEAREFVAANGSLSSG